MKLDDVWCWDCNLTWCMHGVACLRHTPEDKRAEREVKVQAALSRAARVIATRLPIERYVRARVPVTYKLDDPRHPCLEAPVFGRLELGLHYERSDKPSAYRGKLIEVADLAIRGVMGARFDAHLEAWRIREHYDLVVLDEDIADTLTEDINDRVVRLWGDRPRVIEVWRGDEDDEPLTQVYAPHGMPRWR